MNPIIVEIYIDPDGYNPFDEWFNGLKDSMIQDKILTRLDRVIKGNLGDWRPIKGLLDVIELRFTHGSGYRIYCGKDGNRLIILLCGGDKRTQKKDIKKAGEYWNDYQQKNS